MTSMRRSSRLLALLAALALFGAACGEADDTGGGGTEVTATDGTEPTTDTMTDTMTETTGTEAAAVDGSDYRACMVTDTGGVDDRSFNQTAYAGLTGAVDEYGISEQVLESQTQADFDPNISQFVSQDCNLIVTVGFLLDDATQSAAQANPDQHFAIVDVDFFDADAGEDITYDNVRELTFQTDEAAFLAGYVAAATTESGVVGTYGGINIPTVTIFMDGFLAGVNYHNAQKGTDVQVLGWDGNDGQFTGDFEDQSKGRQVTEQLLQNGADVIMPVAGPVGLGSGAAIQALGQGKLIWVDTDGFESASQFQDLMLTSVVKNMDVAVQDTIEQDISGNWEGGLYVGTLENDGVGIAPFHSFEDQVPAELQGELDQIREQIIAGELSVKPEDHQG